MYREPLTKYLNKYIQFHNVHTIAYVPKQLFRGIMIYARRYRYPTGNNLMHTINEIDEKWYICDKIQAVKFLLSVVSNLKYV
jgi:hypothetical protein